MKAYFWIALATALAVGAPLEAQRPAAGRTDRAEAVRSLAPRWTAAEAHRWYDKQPWILGANYANASAINQLDMFQAATWNPKEIDRELGWAKQFGMNTMRVYLHDLLHQQDPAGFKRRLDQFLTIASRHGIRPMFVLFDSCWNPDPALGPQHPPIPGVHNSGWVQSPGRADLIDPRNDTRFRRYVEDIVGTFAKDPRVLAWDLWNEPDNQGGGMYNDDQLAQEQKRIEQLLPQVFAWARSRRPIQPLTSGLWIGADWSPGAATLTPIQRTQIEESDVISFHNYEWPESFERRIAQLKPYGRPILCTEWLARSAGSTPDTILPIAARENIGMVNWGFVKGEIQTHLPWDSWERPYTVRQPVVWFHDLLQPDGKPYRQREAEIFQTLAATKRRTSR